MESEEPAREGAKSYLGPRPGPAICSFAEGVAEIFFRVTVPMVCEAQGKTFSHLACNNNSVLYCLRAGFGLTRQFIIIIISRCWQVTSPPTEMSGYRECSYADLQYPIALSNL